MLPGVCTVSAFSTTPDRCIRYTQDVDGCSKQTSAERWPASMRASCASAGTQLLFFRKHSAGHRCVHCCWNDECPHSSCCLFIFLAAERKCFFRVFTQLFASTCLLRSQPSRRSPAHSLCQQQGGLARALCLSISERSKSAFYLLSTRRFRLTFAVTATIYILAAVGCHSQ